MAAVPPSLVESLLHAGLRDGTGLEVLGSGVGASPGMASGVLCLTAEAVLDASDRGEAAVLVCDETTPADEIGMQLADGIVTARGGMASHAAVVARGWGIPAVVGLADLQVAGDHAVLGGRRLEEWSAVSLDGTTGEVFAGAAEVAVADEIPELDLLLSWADEVRGDRVGVRANADRADDAARARSFGAEGIGLCRTEHMFLGDRLPVIRRFLLAEDPGEGATALEELGAVQRVDLAAVLGPWRHCPSPSGCSTPPSTSSSATIHRSAPNTTRCWEPGAFGWPCCARVCTGCRPAPCWPPWPIYGTPGATHTQR